MEEAFKKKEMSRDQSVFRGLRKKYTTTFLMESIRTRSVTCCGTLVNQEKVSKSLQFGTGEATTYTSVNSSCQDFPSWKRPVPAYLPGFQI